MFATLHYSDPDRIQLFEIVGRIDSTSALTLSQTLEEAIVSGRNQLLLDLSSVQYMNSAGLRELVQVFKRVQRVGGALTIVNPSDHVRRLLELVGLDTVFEIYVDPLWEPSRLLSPNLPPPPRQLCYFA